MGYLATQGLTALVRQDLGSVSLEVGVGVYGKAVVGGRLRCRFGVNGCERQDKSCQTRRDPRGAAVVHPHLEIELAIIGPMCKSKARERDESHAGPGS